MHAAEEAFIKTGVNVDDMDLQCKAEFCGPSFPWSGVFCAKARYGRLEVGGSVSMAYLVEFNLLLQEKGD